MKPEANGYPGGDRSPEDEERCVESFGTIEMISLDWESIKSNAAKRSLAKLFLKSMWGKLTEMKDRTQTKFTSEPKELYRFVATPGIEVTNLTFGSDDVVWVSWKHAPEEHVSTLHHTNEAIGV